MNTDSIVDIINKGVVKENPVFILTLGLCPALAVSTSAINAIGMGLSTLCVLLCSNIVISLIKKIVPNKIRIPAYIIIIAGFVSIVQLLLKAFLPEIDKSLGIYIPLIVVNCVVLGRAEVFASKNGVINSIFDAIGMGIGFTLALTSFGIVREILGNGSIFGYDLFSSIFNPMIIMILPPGGFIVFGIILAIINKITTTKNIRKSCAECGDCCSVKN